MAEKSVIDGLLENPSEALNVELKRWIDPTSPSGIEKIAKGVPSLFAIGMAVTLSSVSMTRAYSLTLKLQRDCSLRSGAPLFRLESSKIQLNGYWLGSSKSAYFALVEFFR
jgi:hypothetical protein